MKLIIGFAAQAGSALALLLATPIYLRQMGSDGFGLVTFATVLQAWMVVFDLGVSAVLARQLSRHRAGAMGAQDARNLLFASESVFLTSGAIVFIAFLFACNWIANRWLGSTSVAPEVLGNSLRLIGALIVLRWMSSLYQSALAGLERQIELNSIVLGGAIIRNSLSVVVLFLISRSPVIFFSLNVFLMIVEVFLCRWFLTRTIGFATGDLRRGWRLLLGDAHLAAGFVISTLIVTMIYQSDRLTLSHSLTLSEYGLFGVVTAICAGIAMSVPPFVQAFQPRLTMLLAQNRRADFVHVYRLSAGISFILAMGLAGTIAAEPEWTVFVWTGDNDLSHHLAPVLRLYAAGTGITAYLLTPAILQYAQGRMRLYVIGYCLFAIVWVPAAIWAAWTYGPSGAGVIWLAGNIFYLVVWVPVVHRKFLEPLERKGLDAGLWLRALIIGGILTMVNMAQTAEPDRLGAFALLAMISLSVMMMATASIHETRTFVWHLLYRRGGASPVRDRAG